MELSPVPQATTGIFPVEQVCGSSPFEQPQNDSETSSFEWKDIYEQFFEKVCRASVEEERRLHEALKSFSSNLRERIEMHRCEMDQLLASLQPGVADPHIDHIDRGKLVRGGSGWSSHMSLMGDSSRCSRRGTTLSVQQEYTQIKDRQESNPYSRAWQRLCRASDREYRYYLDLTSFRKIVNGNIFTSLSFALILINVVFLTLVADAELKGKIQASPVRKELSLWYYVADMTFTALFTAELVCRMLADEVFFFVGGAWRWNLFDLMVVLMTLVDTMFSIFGTVKIGVIRVIRMLRVARGLRVVRLVRFFRDLRVLFNQILNSVLPMVWSFVFLGLSILMFSLVFTEVAIIYFEDVHALSIEDFGQSMKDLEILCGSFGMMSLSLVMSITGGINWWELVKPMSQVSTLYVILFVVYILVVMMGVLNVIVGIFVARANDTAARDREIVAEDELHQQTALMQDLEAMFYQLLDSHSGTISLKQFEEAIKREEVRASFAALDLDVTRAKDVFSLMDTDGSGSIEIAEFVVGIMRLKGLAKTVDIHSLMNETARMIRSLRRHELWMEKRFEQLESTFVSKTSTHKKVRCRL
eukprot:CAMPEP_0171072198 /NCGR_PEP_ID=MMETSP0766_2-20121228/10719_1 /TAXON_ID=439317 /ORGANISM="Gambierdiscus australes, Strain CAWD 149" /LENGTH=585 /DNA_ID=CAMNT_0011528767 /DNA_START=15 /DNA_END=1772 /DNA_ORIENTATION=+